MKAKLKLLVLLAFAIGVTCLYAADEKEKVTLEGTLVSSACWFGHKQTGDAMGGHEHCGSMCLKHGDPAGLLTKEQKFHALIISSIRLAPYVGQQVRITGADHEGVIVVDKAEVNKDGKWEEIDLQSPSPTPESKDKS